MIRYIIWRVRKEISPMAEREREKFFRSEKSSDSKRLPRMHTVKKGPNEHLTTVLTYDRVHQLNKIKIV